MRLIDADNLIKDVHEEWDDVQIWDETGDATACEIERLIDAQPTIDQWHYPSKGELPKEGETVLLLTNEGDPHLGHFANEYYWETDSFVRTSVCIKCWQYIVPPPKEEENV